MSATWKASAASSQALPLTALNDALRGVMLEGAGLVGLLPDMALLAAWGP